MLPTFLAVIFLASLIASSSLTTPFLLPSNLTLSQPDLTTGMNRVLCRRDPELRPLSDYSTCIPSLFRLYATPSVQTPILWVPGDFKKWGPETDLGGCKILVDGGLEMEVFSIEALLGPAIWALGKCFVGGLEGRNRLAKTRIGAKKDWLLTIVLELTGVGANDSVS